MNENLDITVTYYGSSRVGSSQNVRVKRPRFFVSPGPHPEKKPTKTSYWFALAVSQTLVKSIELASLYFRQTKAYSLSLRAFDFSHWGEQASSSTLDINHKEHSNENSWTCILQCLSVHG